MDAADYDDWASFADAYLSAAEILAKRANEANFYYLLGPLSQTLGLACELTMKAMLLKLGYNLIEIIKFGHDLEILQSEISKHYSYELEEINVRVAVYMKDNGLSVPEEISKFLQHNGRNTLEYFLLGMQIKALNYNYYKDLEGDVKFRTRYPDPEKRFRQYSGDVILFNMREIRRLSDKL